MFPISGRRLHISDETQIIYKEKKVVDGITLLFNNVHGLAQGPAHAIYPDYTIDFKYDQDIKQGPALIRYPDGTRIYFRYVNDEAHGPAFEIAPDGFVHNFLYENGVVK